MTVAAMTVIGQLRMYLTVILRPSMYVPICIEHFYFSLAVALSHVQRSEAF